MGFAFTREDLDYLVSGSGLEVLAANDGLVLSAGSLLSDLTRLRRTAGEHAAAVAETIRLRRLAVPKLGEQAAGWLLTDEALQQASPQRVARHRAQRVAGVGMHDVTCSIGSDLFALTAGSPVVVGSDLDPIRARMAAHNLRGTGAGVVVGDALKPVSRGLLAYADPARRTSGGRRITSADTLPSVADLDTAWATRPPVLRVPPGIDYDALARPGEVEVVSLDGSAREAVLWPAEFAQVGRRATVLSSDGPGYGLTDQDPDDVPVADVGRWIVDPDPAVVRSHLVRHFAARHGLWQLDPHLAYLTGDVRPAVGRAFEVLDSAPYRERTVADWLRAADAGTVEIKVRGMDLDPDVLRRRLRPALKGPGSVVRTVVLARVGRGQMAYLTAASPAP
ncbi:class I SAM-dependent methyltransferase [Nakamurella silvestris]|nr:class I SAM-dependent methyltransferase [Nakamurella silvestris]